jgi:hypothetical protein
MYSRSDAYQALGLSEENPPPLKDVAKIYRKLAREARY